jgi:hypothetical protein
MLENHDLLISPPDGSPIWRYMSLAKAVAMLQTGSLFFVRTDRLNELDPFEGTVPLPNSDGLDEPSKEALKAIRGRRCVSCWHSQPYESDALWRGYVASGEGLAIRSSVGRLRDALSGAPHAVYAAEVRYIDFDRQRIADDELEFMYLYKRLSFAHEHELRVVIATEVPPPLAGVNVPVNLDALIETVYIAPNAPVWLGPAVAVLFDRLGCPKVVRKSILSRLPE